MICSLAVDLLIVVLLTATIVCGAVLNRRLESLRRDRHDLGSLTESFREATERAEQSIGRLKLTAEALQQRLDKAESLSEDLGYLTERATAVADRMETAIRAARGPGQAPTAAPASAAAKRRASGGEAGLRPRSEAERDLLNAVQSIR